MGSPYTKSIMQITHLRRERERVDTHTAIRWTTKGTAFPQAGRNVEFKKVGHALQDVEVEFEWERQELTELQFKKKKSFFKISYASFRLFGFV